MAKVYFNRLLTGTISFDAIPARYRNAVRGFGELWVREGRLRAERYEALFGQARED